MPEQADLDDLFFYFHDFLITRVELKDSTLAMDLDVPWPPLASIGNNKIRLVLENCSDLRCDHAMAVETAENLSKLRPRREYEDRSTSDPEMVSSLLLEPQHFDHQPPDHYVLHCNSSNPKCAGGKLSFRANGFKIFSNRGDEISIDLFDEWYAAMRRVRDGDNASNVTQP